MIAKQQRMEYCYKHSLINVNSSAYLLSIPIGYMWLFVIYKMYIYIFIDIQHLPCETRISIKQVSRPGTLIEVFRVRRYIGIELIFFFYLPAF